MASVNIDIFKGEIMYCKQQQKKQNKNTNDNVR